MLAVQPGRLVTLDDLVDELWVDCPPRSAVANVRTYAANLRRTFEALPDSQASIARHRNGYRLDVRPEVIDLFCFEVERGTGREALAAGHLDRAREQLGRAVARWKGPMLAGIPLGPVLTARTVTAEEDRLLTVELLADVQLRSGRTTWRFRSCVAWWPATLSVSRPTSLLMRALFERGDNAEALTAYDEIRTTGHQELGVGPGSNLQELRR